MTITPTQLRANLYNLLDQVIETNKPIEIRRNGRIIKLILEGENHRGRLTRLQPHPGTMCAPAESFVHMDWSSTWTSGQDL